MIFTVHEINDQRLIDGNFESSDVITFINNEKKVEMHYGKQSTYLNLHLVKPIPPSTPTYIGQLSRSNRLVFDLLMHHIPELSTSLGCLPRQRFLQGIAKTTNNTSFARGDFPETSSNKELGALVRFLLFASYAVPVVKGEKLINLIKSIDWTLPTKQLLTAQPADPNQLVMQVTPEKEKIPKFEPSKKNLFYLNPKGES